MRGETWQLYQAMEAICPHCPTDGFDVPGSLALPWDQGYMDALPQGVLEWEIIQVAKYLDAGGDPDLI
jgi:hypothetical protein